MEVPPTLAQKCLLTEEENKMLSNFHQQDENSMLVLDLILQGAPDKWELTEKDYVNLMLSCKETLKIMSTRYRFWLKFLGFYLPNIPENFSVLKLYVEFRRQQQFKDWKRKLLTSAVDESRLNSKACPLQISLSFEDSLAFWQAEFKKLITLKTYPTLPQAADLKELLLILKERKQSAKDITTFVLNDVGTAKLNKVLVVVLCAEILKTFNREEVTSNVLTNLLFDVKSILHLIAYLRGVTVDLLKAKKYTFTSKYNIPTAVRKSIVNALAALGWLQLSDAFKMPGLTKALFKSIHIGAALLKALPKASTPQEKANLSRVFLLQAILRRNKYPASESAKEWSSWKEYLIPALIEVNKSKLFKVNDEWLQTTFQAKLSGKCIPNPRKRTVDAILCQDGNVVETWESIFKANTITIPQILLHYRSLLLTGVDPKLIEKKLCNSLAEVDTLKALKVRQLIAAQFSDELLTALAEQIKVGDSLKGSADYSTGPIPLETDKYKQAKLLPWVFKDAKGNPTEKECKKFVTKNIDREYVNNHVATLESVIGKAADLANANFKDSENSAAIVVCSYETNNVLHAGLPPSIPEYTRCSLWRNEGICLEELAGADETWSKFLVGINWCQTKEQNHIDLDLSIMLFDDSGVFLDQVSYTKTSIPGCKHSGDYTSAPYPNGARETVTIDLKEIRKAYPTLANIALCVYSYSGQPMDDLHDASVYVANPLKTGTGPGKMDIIAAARLQGKGKCNFSGFLNFALDGKHHFFFADCALNTRSFSVESSGNLITQSLNRIKTNANSTTPSTPRTFIIGCWYAALVADVVVVTHAKGQSVVKFSDIDESEPNRRFAFFKKCEQIATENGPTASPHFKLPDNVSAKKVYVFGGEKCKADECCYSLEKYACNNSLTTVNLRCDTSAKDDIEVNGFGTITQIEGVEIADLLVPSEDEEQDGKEEEKMQE